MPGRGMRDDTIVRREGKIAFSAIRGHERGVVDARLCEKPAGAEHDGRLHLERDHAAGRPDEARKQSGAISRAGPDLEDALACLSSKQPEDIGDEIGGRGLSDRRAVLLEDERLLRHHAGNGRYSVAVRAYSHLNVRAAATYATTPHAARPSRYGTTCSRVAPSLATLRRAVLR